LAGRCLLITAAFISACFMPLILCGNGCFLMSSFLMLSTQIQSVLGTHATKQIWPQTIFATRLYRSALSLHAYSAVVLTNLGKSMQNKGLVQQLLIICQPSCN
jgi:hypothetical protein